MITYKTWDDFFEDRTCSTRPVVAYGAGWMCRNLIEKGLIDPDMICDRDAEAIGAITVTGKTYPVVATNELFDARHHFLDLFVTIDFAARSLKYKKETMSFFDNLFGKYKTEIYMQKPKDSGMITINGKHYFYRQSTHGHALSLERMKASFAFKDVDGDLFRRKTMLPHDMRVVSDTMISLPEYRSERRNTIAGRRRTLFQPVEFEHRIHVFGDSRIVGDGQDDADVVCSILQKKLNEYDKSYKVINYGMGVANFIRMHFQILNTPINEGDIVLLSSHCCSKMVEQGLETEINIERLDRINQYCCKKKAQFAFVNWVQLAEIISPSAKDKQLLDEVIAQDFEGSVKRMLQEPISFNFVQQQCAQRGVKYFDTVEIFSRHADSASLFVDRAHWTKEGHKVAANALYDVIEWLSLPLINDNQHVNTEILHQDAKFKEIIRDRLEKNGTLQYVTELKGKYKKADVENAGAIVMNCNPFTMGHRYLIEWAARQVECLYVLVVEEDRSVFSFKDRFRLVKENTQDIENVVVVPSGEFVISSVTFPEYFSKESLRETKINAGEDLLMFAGVIAPALDIKTRFVGQEPFDPVTPQYNEQMQNILPDHGIEVVEIPRKCLEGQAISASRVRKLLGESKWDEIKQLVPETTYRYLREREGTP